MEDRRLKGKCENIITVESQLKVWKIFVGILITLFVGISGITYNSVDALATKHTQDMKEITEEYRNILEDIKAELSDNRVDHAEIKKDILRVCEKVDDATSVAAFTQRLVKELKKDQK